LNGPPLLSEAIPARLDDEALSILDLGEEGALVEHSIASLDPSRLHRLRFTWEEQTIDIQCRVRESALQDLLSDQRQKLTWHARLVFEPEDGLTSLRKAIESYRGRLESAREANLIGEDATEPGSARIMRVGDAIRVHKPGYLAIIFRDGGWITRATKSPTQPLDGFTVAEFEDEQQIQLLKSAYEESDVEGRDLIRKFAAAALEPDSTPG
jgi:hypothetical protein